jgi:hypothetical protein
MTACREQGKVLVRRITWNMDDGRIGPHLARSFPVVCLALLFYRNLERTNRTGPTSLVHMRTCRVITR